jgi:uncharacterized protein (DUF697 family)
MNSPVDIKAVLDAMSDAEEARSLPIRVHVYFDESASADLANIAMAATRTNAGNATVVYDSYPPQHAIPDASADLAILVAGGDGRTGKLYNDLHNMGVPVAVFAVNREAVCAAAKATRNPIAPEDVIAPSASPDEHALPDRADSSPIDLDSNDAKLMFGEFGSWVVEVFKEKRLAFANAFGCVRRPLALESVNETAVQNAGIGVVAIIPGADMPVMLLLQAKMILEMAAAYGKPMTQDTLIEMAAAIPAGIGARGLARAIGSRVGFLSFATNGVVAYGATLVLGHLMHEYYVRGGLPTKAVEALSTLEDKVGSLGGGMVGDVLHRVGELGEKTLLEGGDAAGREEAAKAYDLYANTASLGWEGFSK